MNKKLLSISIITSIILSQAIASESLIEEVENSDVPIESNSISMGSCEVSIVDYNTRFSIWDNVADFNNPCYESGKTEQRVLIPNGSMVNFAAAGIIGSTIRASSAFNEIPNPLGIAHSGVIVNDDPRDVFNLIVDLLPGGKDYSEANELSETEGKALINELKISYYDVISAVSAPKISVPFIMEATGSVSEVLSRVFPYVHIHALSKVLLEYDGNAYLRQLKTYVPTDQTRGFVKKYIGRSHEAINTLTELFYAVSQANKKERVGNVFCSELAALFYEEVGVIEHDTILASNVIPEMLSSGAKEADLLKDKALPDIPLKILFAVNERENTTDTCWKWLMKKLLALD